MKNRGKIIDKELSLDDLPRKGSKRYCELVTKVKGGDIFTRRVVVHGRPYYQRCQWIYVGGKRKLKILKHLGTRKPREKIRGVGDGKVSDNIC